MAMQAELWSINALATEFHKDRRTMAKRLEGLKPAEVKKVGKRTEKRYYLADVVDHLHNPTSTDAVFEAEAMKQLQRVVAKWLVPGVLSNDHFIGTLIGNLEDKGFTREQTLLIYKNFTVSLFSGVSDMFDDEDMHFDTGYVLDAIIKDGGAEAWAAFEVD